MRRRDGSLGIDCRWIGMGGAGRVTEWLLRGLHMESPPGDWLLWGPTAISEFKWPNARHVKSTAPPNSLFGQRAALSVPRVQLMLYLHQVRPLVRSRSITVIYDTIPLRFGRHRYLKKEFLRAVARTSSRILTFSEHSKRLIISDIGVSEMKVDVIRLPVDEAFVERITKGRAPDLVDPFILYVGRFAEHKNLRRLIEGFKRTKFRTDGGRLLLVGGTPGEIRQLEPIRADDPSVQLMGYASQAILDDLYKRAKALALPSLEEGFGLPAWEALTCEIPICISDAPALVEATLGLIQTFDRTSVDDLSAAIDRTVYAPDDAAPLTREALRRAPRLDQFARRLIDLMVAST